MSDILEELKKRLLAVIDEYKKFRPQAPTNNNPSSNPSTNTNQAANNNNPITASKTLSASVGEGGTNKPEDVALVKTLINKFVKAFDLNDAANLGKVGATTIKVIKQFQQAKVGLANPDGLIEVGGKSWKVLNGEAQPVSNSQGGAADQLINSIQTTGASSQTAGQDGLNGKGLSGVEVSQTMAKTDLERVTKYKDLFVKIGKEQGVPASILAAIASRETRGREVVGDHGNGFGIIQVDVRYHPEKVAKIEAKQGLARVEESIRQGAIILKDYIGQIKAKFPNWTPAQQLKGALAAYNSGVSNVQTLEGMDKGTTGDDYSSDVIARAQFMGKNGFAEESAAANNQPPANGETQPAANNQPVTASTTLSDSVGEGGKNKPEDVALVKTLINKFIKAFDLNDKANLGKVGATTIKVIKQFQQEKVGLESPDGRIDVGGKTWKVLNGETPPIAAATSATAAGGNAALAQEVANSAKSEANSRNTVGRCYAAVADAVERVMGGGIYSGNSAYMAAGQMASKPHLFKEISASPSNVRSLPVGTIVVWAAGGGPHEVHGHIMVCLGGGQEASDHINSAYNWPGGRCRAFLPISKQ